MPDAMDLLMPVPIDLATYIERGLAKTGVKDVQALMSGYQARVSEYFDEFSVRMAGFDTVGTPLIPPNAHVLDHLARAWDLVGEDDAANRPPARTVACPVEDLECDLCGAQARYETHVQDRGERALVHACLDCTREQGDAVLGPGASTYLMYMDEVPTSVRAVCDEICRTQGRTSLWADDAPTDASSHDDGTTTDGNEMPTVPYSAPALTDPKAIAVRLRTLWTQVIGPDLEQRGHDLGDAWSTSLLTRIGTRLTVSSTIDFGAGDPFDGQAGATIRRLLSADSDGTVTEVTYECAHRGIAARRRAVSSRSVDVYHPEDCDARSCSQVAQALSTALSKSAPDREATLDLYVAGVSRHRIWLAVPTEVQRKSVGSTPGTAANLTLAISRIQKVKQPLFDIVVDPEAKERYHPLLLP